LAHSSIFSYEFKVRKKKYTMDHQNWTVVTLTRKSATYKRNSFKHNGNNDIDKIVHKKKVESNSLQELIRKRMELKLSQEKADHFCQFPKYTFKNIESQRALPTDIQHSIIQKQFGVQLKISY
jgi:hypothetical protein